MVVIKQFAVSFVKRQRHVKRNPLKNCFKGIASTYVCVCICVCDYAPKHSSRFHIKIIPRKYQKASSFGLVSQYPAPDTSIDNFVSCYSKR